ncbi:MAG: isoleucine--tRNA ligase [Pseudomonadota bacterium]
MTKADTDGGRDWRETLFLPETDFPMRAGLPKREPEWLERWKRIDIYKKQREAAKGREKYVLHDGPPYANGNLHIGHALNKILKDVVARSMQMLGKDSNYVPGWDCHGLPIEWKIEEQYRAKGKDKDAVPTIEFRKECRAFAEHWISVQREEFQRLGCEGDWWNPYLTMAYDAEARIANELMKFAMNGLLYRGSKPVMWSVVERTALAEAEVEYHDYESDTVWVKFPVVSKPVPNTSRDAGSAAPVASVSAGALDGASIVIWTTTPWTMPGNRAISYSPRVSYALYEVASAEHDFGPQPGERLVFATSLAETCAAKAKVTLTRLSDVTAGDLASTTCRHPLAQDGYAFDVPLLAGDHVTDEDGTGFVHTAPGHGREDFDIWMEKAGDLKARGIVTTIPYTVGEDGKFTSDAPGFEGKQVITDKGKKGDANEAVIEALIGADMLFARGRLKHQYPHSWRSKKPVIFRNTPQWFIGMDEAFDLPEDGAKVSLRSVALEAIDQTRFVPPAGQNRLRGMIEAKPDWVLSRQRAWGVPITVFVKKGTNDYIPNAEWNASGELIDRIVTAFQESGADAWYEEGAKARFLDGLVDDVDEWDMVTDILDVWFDSGSTHAFCLEQREDLKWPADLYLEGSDQHRGWFHSSLLESCGTRGRAPYDGVLTHGFVLDENGEKMSKGRGNITAPQEIIKDSGADILRLWVVSSDYAGDLRIGKEILKTSIDAYRKLRNTMRFMLGNLAHSDPADRVPVSEMPELERYILHRLSELDALVRQGYQDFEYRRVFEALSNFCNLELSSFYFDIRKDTLYCEPTSSSVRRAALTVLEELYSCLTAWLAPMLVFTMEEVWLARNPGDEESVHLRLFPDVSGDWQDDALAAKWQKVRRVRRVITGALEVERREKRIGSSLEAAPEVYVSDPELRGALDGLDLAEIAITSGLTLADGNAPGDAFTLDEVSGVAVIPTKAVGTRCARSWRVTNDVGSDPDYPELSARDAAAVREFDARAQAAE